MSGLILRLPAWRRPFARTTTSGYCVLLFPDSTEGRWFDRLPTPGTRLRSEGGHGYWAETYVVDEVLQSGRNTYTVTLVDRRRHLRNLRARSEGDLAAELLELARRASDTVNQARWRRKYRGYLP